jgi:hypothetical protein
VASAFLPVWVALLEKQADQNFSLGFDSAGEFKQNEQRKLNHVPQTKTHH